MSLNNVDSNQFALCTINDVDGGASIVKTQYMLRRVVVELALMLRAKSVTEDIHGLYTFGLPWLLGVADAEDQDAEEIRQGGLQSWLQSGRILQSGIQSIGYNQADSGVAGGLSHNGEIVILPNISIDWKGRAKMGPDDILWLVVRTEADQFPGNGDYVDNDMSFHVAGFTRTLISMR